jgi:hypothetical protein
MATSLFLKIFLEETLGPLGDKETQNKIQGISIKQRYDVGSFYRIGEDEY